MEESNNLKYIRQVQAITQHSNLQAYWTETLHSAQDVKVEPTAVVLGDDLTARVKLLDIRLKACYKNALLTAIALNCEYVEGFVYFEEVGIPIEHAWNCYKGRYFDVTNDLLLQNSKPAQYTQLVKVNSLKALEITQKVGYTGNIWNTICREKVVKRKTN